MKDIFFPFFIDSIHREAQIIKAIENINHVVPLKSAYVRVLSVSLIKYVMSNIFAA